MKNILLGVLALIAVGAAAFIALKPVAPDQGQIATNNTTDTGSQNTGTVETGSMSEPTGEQYSIAQNSTLVWLGRKVGGQHTGTISLTDGFMRVQGDMIQAGEFTVDMNSITVSDLPEGAMNTKLVDHLKSADFFDVTKHTTAKFVLNAVVSSGSEMIAKGNLTVKGNTHPLQFPIDVAKQGNKMNVKADFFIDKDLWNISSNPIVDKYLGISFNLDFGPAL